MVVTEIETNLDNSILTENWNDPLLQHCVFEPNSLVLDPKLRQRKWLIINKFFPFFFKVRTLTRVVAV